MNDVIYTAAEIRGATFAEAKKMVRHNITTNDKWLLAAVKAISKRQTTDEYRAEQTNENNQRGWSASDAMLMTSFTKQIARWDAETTHKYPTPLSTRQFAKARQRIAKYSGQLTRIARKEAVN